MCVIFGAFHQWEKYQTYNDNDKQQDNCVFIGFMEMFHKKSMKVKRILVFGGDEAS